jgi:hypothetical protein
LKGLEKVRLRKDQATPEEVEAFRKAVPDCKPVWDTAEKRTRGRS